MRIVRFIVILDCGRCDHDWTDNGAFHLGDNDSGTGGHKNDDGDIDDDDDDYHFDDGDDYGDDFLFFVLTKNSSRPGVRESESGWQKTCSKALKNIGSAAWYL